MIHIENINKSFEETQALKEINLQIASGALFGLIGPDGAGKTTLFRILATLLLPDSGRATIEEWDVVKQFRKIRNHVGYMPGKFSLYQDLTVEENLQFFATTFGTTIEENYHLIKDIYSQIEPFKNRKAGALSGGMKQKLALSCALVHKPKVLLLDEPTTGVDPVSRSEFWDILQNLKPEGITILVSTPYMDEAGLCEQVALIQKGEILAVDTPDRIERGFSQDLYEVSSTHGMYHLITDLGEYEFSNTVFAFGEAVHYTDVLLESEQQVMERLQHYLHDKGHEQVHVRKIAPGIEDRFMELTN